MEIVKKNPVNDATPKSVVASSFFPELYHHLTTQRFGEYQPFFSFEGVPKDNLVFKCAHDVRSYTLKAPLLGDIKIKKDYFLVPFEAILPRNWDKVYTNPIVGDDVDPFNVGCSVKRFPYKIKRILEGFRNYISYNPDDEDNPDTVTLARQFMYMLTAERFLSAGSLLDNLGAKLGSIARFGFPSDSFELLTFDQAFESWISALKTKVNTFTLLLQSETYGKIVDVQGADTTGSSISLHLALTLMRDESFTITNVVYKSGQSALPDCPSKINFSTNCVDSEKAFPLSLASCIAYQIVTSHFYSNDHIDYIYSAELWRQNLQSLWKKIQDLIGGFDIGQMIFNYNGIDTLYDVCSAKYFDQTLAALTEYASDEAIMPALYDYFRIFFGFNRSLRYVDYFTGSKSAPLAVGDVGAAVSGGQVSAIDTTISIMKQRFFNAVNRGHRKFEEYIKNLFPGARPSEDWHNPHWLGHTDDVIYGSEVDNTGDDQFTQASSVSSVLRGNADRFAFDVSIDRPCILLGMCYFDINRAYWKTINRDFFHYDRFTMFNPFMQTIGDQQIYRSEIDSSRDFNSNFGYTLRHMEYKQRYSTASGGFVTDSLPGWSFLADDTDRAKDVLTISPSYIRSTPSELDKFYVMLSGYSLANYFHFVIDNKIEIKANRDMIYAPSIL